jgi:hypothetical protein
MAPFLSIARSRRPLNQKQPCRRRAAYETAATFAIEWKGSYRINGPAFVYSDQNTGRVVTILGYPTDKLVDIE